MVITLFRSSQTPPEVAVEGRYDRLGLPRGRREEVGRRAKRILDVARLDFVAGAFPHLGGAKLVRYCSPEVSLENVALIAAPAREKTEEVEETPA